MEVKNYYKLTGNEIDIHIAKIRDWLFKYSKHPKQKKAYSALLVALNAKEKISSDIIDSLT